jgi:hypothetical protein
MITFLNLYKIAKMTYILLRREYFYYFNVIYYLLIEDKFY